MDLGHYLLAAILIAAIVYVVFLLRWLNFVRQNCHCGIGAKIPPITELGINNLIELQQRNHKKWSDDTFVMLSPNLNRVELTDDEK